METTATTTPSNGSSRTKVLSLLAVLITAGAMTLQSGATFTSQSANPMNVVTAGTLRLESSAPDQAVITATDVKPGDVTRGTVTLTNTGTLPGDLGFTEVESASEFAPGVLTLTVTDTTPGGSGDVVYTGDFGGLADGARTEVGVLEPGEARTYEFTVELSRDADNTQQGLAASATFRWDAVQVD